MKLKGAIARKEIKDLGAIHYTIGHHRIPRIWIIIADKSIAKIYSKIGESIEMLGEASPSAISKDKANQQVGRTTNAAHNSKPINYEPSMSPARRRSFKFAHEIADWLEQALHKEAFDRLIIVAPPQTLGDLRTALNKAVSSRIVAEINKDLTKLTEHDLRTGLEKAVWF